MHARVVFQKLAVAVGTWLLITANSTVGGARNDALQPTKAHTPTGSSSRVATVPVAREGTLDNGLLVMVIESARVPLVDVALQIRGAGGHNDPPDAPGLAVLTALAVSEEVRARTSAELKLTAGQRSTVAIVTGEGVVDELPELLNAAGQLVRDLIPSAQSCTRARARYASTLAHARNEPDALALELLARLTNGDKQASGSGSAAERDAGRSISDDRIAQFYRERYAPQQAVLAVTGDVSFATVRAAAEPALGSWPRRPNAPARAESPALSPAGVHLLPKERVESPTIVVGVRGVSRTDPDYPVLQVIDALLARDGTARLRRALSTLNSSDVSEPPLTRVVAPTFAGSWSVLVTAPYARVAQVLDTINDTLDRLSREPVPQAELAVGKAAVVTNVVADLDSPDSRLTSYIARWVFDQPPDYLDRHIQSIRRVTSSQVQETARRLFDRQRRQIIVVGDRWQLEERLRALGSLTVHPTE